MELPEDLDIRQVLSKEVDDAGRRIISNAEITILENHNDKDGEPILVEDRERLLDVIAILRTFRQQAEKIAESKQGEPQARSASGEVKEERKKEEDEDWAALAFNTAFVYFQQYSGADYAFASPQFVNARERYLRQENLFVVRKRGVKGLGKCGKCNGEELIIVAKQTRSADEPMTVFFTCGEPSCNNSWRVG